jgi:phage terminase large subunit-like protein
MARIAEIGGDEWMPWQDYFAGCGTELAPDGRFAHRGVLGLVGRQNGKTRILKVRIKTGLFAPQLESERLILHTAQDRTVPRKLFEELVDTIESTPAFRRQIPKNGIRESNGQERIRTRDGTTYMILAPRQAAFRTWSADLLIFDELRELRPALWGAALPTQRVRPNPQWWAVSNAGNADSDLLNGLVARGRRAAANHDLDPRICYLEWSAEDPTCALNDREAWKQSNPALGHILTEEAILEDLANLREEDFRIEVLCQFLDTGGTPAVPAVDWAACAAETPVFDPETTRVWFGVGVDADGRDAALLAGAWADIDDEKGEPQRRLVVSLVDSWTHPDAIDLLAIADRIKDWVRMWRPRTVGYDPATAQIIADYLEKKTPAKVEKITGTAFTSASSLLWDAVVNRRIAHPNDPLLNAQIAAAARTDTGDGNWKITRKDSGGPIPAVTALARVVAAAYGPEVTPEIHA